MIGNATSLGTCDDESGAVAAKGEGPVEFMCRRCGACCRIPDGICRVSDAEISRISAFLGMEETDFISMETEVAPDRKSLMLRNTPTGACVWLDEESRCRIHPVKPDKCRTFPFEWVNADSDSVCPSLAALATADK